MKRIAEHGSVQATLDRPDCPLIVHEGKVYEHRGVQFIVSQVMKFYYDEIVFTATEATTGLRIVDRDDNQTLLEDIAAYCDAQDDGYIRDRIERGMAMASRYRQSVIDYYGWTEDAK